MMKQKLDFKNNNFDNYCCFIFLKGNPYYEYLIVRELLHLIGIPQL